MHWSCLIYKCLLARPMYDSLKELSRTGSLPNSHLSSYRATIKYRLLTVLMAHRPSPATYWPPTIFDKTHPLCGNSIVAASITVCTHMMQVPASIHSCFFLTKWTSKCFTLIWRYQIPWLVAIDVVINTNRVAWYAPLNAHTVKNII